MNEQKNFGLTDEELQKAWSCAKAAIVLTIVVYGILFLCLSNAHAGMDFRQLRGSLAPMVDAQADFVAAVQAHNKEQAQVAYERLQQIIRALPDKARQMEEMRKYQAILERIRELYQENMAIIEKEKFQQLLRQSTFAILGEGAYIETRVSLIKKGWTK